jgi:hypothetical protein
VARILGASPVKIPAGGSARVETSLSTNTAFGQIQVELNEPPEGISAGGVSTGPQGIEITLQSDATKVKPGLRGNLIVSVYQLPRPPASGPATRPPGAVQRRNFLGTLPAIPFEIVEADRRARGGAK